MDERNNQTQGEDILKKPPMSIQKKQILIGTPIFLLVFFMLLWFVFPKMKSEKQASAQTNKPAHDVIEETLPAPKSSIISNSSEIKHSYQPKVAHNFSDPNDIVSIVEKKQQEKEAMEKAKLLARIESARIRAQEQEKMNGSSAVSGLGVGSGSSVTGKADKRGVGQYENGNTAFLEQTSTNASEESEADILGDLRFRITQGKLIKGVIDSAIDSDLPGLIRAHVTENVYGDQGDIILIPNGARLIGQYRSGKMKNGQIRVFIAWTRLIEPNGITVALASAGSDELGRAGMTGEVDKHTWERFGSATLVSVLSAGASLYRANTQDQYNSVSEYRSNLTQGFANLATQELEEHLNIQPTIRIPQGTPLSIIVSHDLSFENAIMEMGARI